METLIATCILLGLSFVGFGVGVLFFNKTPSHDACGRVPEIETDKCASQEAGLCPFEDNTGALKMQRKARLSYSKKP
jgi:hypothetical protein